METDGGFPSLASAQDECRRWIEAVTGRQFAHRDFRLSLQDGVLLCELVSRIKPGTILRINGLSTTYAYLDNIRSFLQACEQFGLKGSQLFSITDLQESSPTESNRNVGEGDRRMRNVVLTIYWLGKAASNMPSYAGPELNISAFAGLVGTKETHSLFDGIETKHLTKKTSIKRQDQGVNMRNKEGPEESGTEQAKDGSEKFRDLTVRITKIRRQESGFGLTVAGGKEDGILPFIDGIKPGSSASLSNLQMGDEIHWINGQTIVGATKQKLLTHIAKGDKIGSLLLKIRRYSKRLRTSSYSSDDLPPSVEENQVKSGLSKQVGVADDDKGVVAFNVDVSSEQGAGDDSQIQERERNGFIPENPYEDPEDFPELPHLPSPPRPPLPSEEILLAHETDTVEDQSANGSPTQEDASITQRARQKWLESDKETMESIQSSSLPQTAKKQSLNDRLPAESEANRRARSVEREKEEVEFLKRRRFEQSSRASGRPLSQEVQSSKPSLQEQIRAELRRSPLPSPLSSRRAGDTSKDHQDVVMSSQLQGVARSPRTGRELTPEEEQKKVVLQQMQEEADEEFLKMREEQEKMRQLEREADELIAMAEAELRLADEHIEEEERKMSDSYKEAIKKSESNFPVTTTPSSGSGSSSHQSPIVRRSEPRVSPGTEPMSLRHLQVSSDSGSRYSLSAWSDSNMAYEDEYSGLDNGGEKILENELKKLHNLELEWAQEHREERRKRDSEGAMIGADVKENKALERKMQQKLEDEKRKLAEEKAALEEEKRRQLVEQERQRKELEMEKKKWEEEKEKHLQMEMQSRLKLEEEKRELEREKQRYSEERERRRRGLENEARLRQEEELRLRQQVDMEKKKRREEEDARRLALEEERQKLLIEDRQRQMEMQEEMKRLQQVESERKRRQEEELRLRRQQEEEEKRQAHGTDRAFTQQSAEKRGQPIEPQNNAIEEKVRRVKEDIALTVQREEERRKEKTQRQREEKPRERDGGERDSRKQRHRRSREPRPHSHTSNESFHAQTVFHDDSGVFMTEL